MDNHLCATWCWMQECETNEKYNFVHIDRHADLRGCGYVDLLDELKKTPHIAFEDYLKIEFENAGRFKLFTWDNYIRACHYMFPNWFNTNFFFTQDDNDCDTNDWGYDKIYTRTECPLYVRTIFSQYIHEPSQYLEGFREQEMWNKKWIVNIDLDFFWDENKVLIFSEEFIGDFAKRLNEALNNIQVVTIALSPDCIGGECWDKKWDNVLHVMDLFKRHIPALSDWSVDV